MTADTPRTAAGRALLAAISVNERDEDGRVIGHVLRSDPVLAILAIEAGWDAALDAVQDGWADAEANIDGPLPASDFQRGAEHMARHLPAILSRLRREGPR